MTFKTLKNGTAKTSDFAVTPDKKTTTVTLEGTHTITSEDDLVTLLTTIGAVAEAAGLPNPLSAEDDDTPSQPATGERSFDDDEVLAISSELEQAKKDLDNLRAKFHDSQVNKTMMTTAAHEEILRKMEKLHAAQMKETAEKLATAVKQRDEAIALLG